MGQDRTEKRLAEFCGSAPFGCESNTALKTYFKRKIESFKKKKIDVNTSKKKGHVKVLLGVHGRGWEFHFAH